MQPEHEQIIIIDNRKAYRARLVQALQATPFNTDLIKRVMWSKLRPIT